MRRPGAHCAVIFCMLGNATAIMVTRVGVMEKIALSAKRSYYADDAGREKSVRDERSELNAEAPHL
jgi:hypothetical protein